MKKLMIGVGLLIATTQVTVAQQHVAFGVKGGLNIAKFTKENDAEFKFKPSVHLGVLAHIHINKSFAIQPELVFSAQGSKYTVNNTDFRNNLNYINLPVLFQLMTSNGFRFETGPQAGVLVSAKSKTGNTTTDAKDDFKSTDLAWAFGVGYIAASRLGFDVRYNMGLSDVTKSTESNFKNSVIQAGIFYQFK